MRIAITAVVVGFLLLLNFNLLKGSLETSDKLSELSIEENQVKELEIKTEDLKKELAARDSSFFVEQEARNRLGYGKSGETTIIIQDSEIAQAGKAKVREQKSNLQQWLDLIKF